MPCRLYKSVKVSAGEQLISHYTDKLFKTTAITFDMECKSWLLVISLTQATEELP